MNAGIANRDGKYSTTVALAHRPLGSGARFEIAGSNVELVLLLAVPALLSVAGAMVGAQLLLMSLPIAAILATLLTRSVISRKGAVVSGWERSSLGTARSEDAAARSNGGSPFVPLTVLRGTVDFFSGRRGRRPVR